MKHKFPKDMTVVNEITQIGNSFRVKVKVLIFFRILEDCYHSYQCCYHYGYHDVYHDGYHYGYHDVYNDVYNDGYNNVYNDG